MKKCLGAVSLFAVFVFLSGCSSSPTEVSLSPQSSIIFATQTIQLTASDSRGLADLQWSVTQNQIPGSQPVPSGATATVESDGTFTAPDTTQNATYTVTVTSAKDKNATASATVTVIASGQMAATNQPQVATYTLTPPTGTNTTVQFSTDTSYALKTWTQPAPTSGGALSFFVAGMLPNTLYHMRAVVTTPDGQTVNDMDHTFTTTSIPASQVPQLTVTTTPGATPQSGVEVLDLIGIYPNPPLAVVDLAGNLLWSYQTQGTSSDTLQGVHLLPNGHFLMAISDSSTDPITPVTIQPNTIKVLREVDLAGTTIKEESLNALNAALPKIGVTYTLLTFHHDVIALPTGHWIALANILQPCTGLTTCSTNPNLLGDVIIDLAPQTDGTMQPVWTWSTFDHLDTSRAPMGYPDWTHSNALVYSPDDGNLLLSIRAQSWILKIDYANGTGAGDILWKLGEGGDFTLMGGTDPTDWFYAQHGPAFATTNTTGKFQLTVMDNGNTRLFPDGESCTADGQPLCPYYSTGQLFEIDEDAKTATILTKYVPGEFSFWGGNEEVLANGNLESDFNAGTAKATTDIFETTQASNQQVVWHMSFAKANAYRGFRLGSLYPGVQW